MRGERETFELLVAGLILERLGETDDVDVPSNLFGGAEADRFYELKTEIAELIEGELSKIK